ncbi:MAG: DUF4440 domain-containing protein [Ponticaulis sp.]|nr:DUF4440 domain-containing protein [Ponticaulis sp.]
MKSLIGSLVLLSVVGFSGCATSQAVPTTLDESAETIAIESVLATQQAAWNEGDIPAFMDGYWKSDDLRFASGGNITYGWQATLDRYLTSYDSPEKMGKLSFSNLVTTISDADDAMVFGKWELERATDKPWGLFTLHFRKFGDDWLIVSDHTSSGGN